MKIVPVILAGGIGERFWPFSRSSKPKQLLPIISDKTMLEETLERVGLFNDSFVKPLIVTGQNIAGLIEDTLGTTIEYDVIIEPVGKNTAPAVAAAASFIAENYGDDAVMAVLSADHAISPKELFADTVRYAASIAYNSENLVVFGISPSRPDTGYGYIHLGASHGTSGNLKSNNVNRFVEKPSVDVAQQYLDSGEYLWNSGMFVWSASTILNEFKKHMPSVYELLEPLKNEKFSQDAVNTFYHAVIKESIDYGIMEHASEVIAVVGEFMWDDIGSWESLSRVLPQDDNGNVASGVVYHKDCKNSIIANNSSLSVATIGVEDVVVVTVNDSVMVIHRDKLPQFKEYLNEIKGLDNFPQELF